MSDDDATFTKRLNLTIVCRCTPISVDERECERQGNFGYILPPVTSAYLTTRNKFSFLYGKVQVRCRVPIGDYIYARKNKTLTSWFWWNLISLMFLYQEITLKPVSGTNSSEHLKILFVRGNEKLFDGADDVGGNRVYGGAILSKNAKNNDKWMKVSSCSEHVWEHT